MYVCNLFFRIHCGLCVHVAGVESLLVVLKPGPPRHFIPSRRHAVLVDQNVRKTLKCCICHRPQCVFEYGINTLHEYACGGSLVPDNNSRRRLFIVRRELACQMSMEVPYYSAKRVKLPSVCFHCSGNYGAVLANDADNIELHAVVRPICTFWKDAGKKPAAHGTKFVTKKMKKKSVFCFIFFCCEIIYLFVSLMKTLSFLCIGVIAHYTEKKRHKIHVRGSYKH